MRVRVQRTARMVVLGVLLVPVLAFTDEPAKRASDATRAEELLRQAEALYETPREWRKVARLLEASAKLRMADDAEAYACLRTAASLRAGFGEHGHARRLLVRAAEQALARGDILAAADSYVTAAVSAAEQGRTSDAVRLAEKARLLADSPLLGDAERVALLERID